MSRQCCLFTRLISSLFLTSIDPTFPWNLNLPSSRSGWNIDRRRKRKEKHRTKLFNAALLSTIGRSIERKKWEKLAGREGRGIRLFLNRETLWRSCPPDCPASWHCSYLARTCTITATRKRFVYRAFFQLVTGNTMPGVLVWSPRCRSLKIVLTKRFDRSNEMEEEVNNSL